MTDTTTIPSIVPLTLLINGEETAPAGGATFDVRNPANDQVIAQIADAGATDATHALDLAVDAQKEWAKFSPRSKAEVLRTVYEKLTEHSEDIARVITLEMGKPLPEARGEVAYGAEYFCWFSEEAVRNPGRLNTSPQGLGQIAVTRTPVGPVLAITPWNFPLSMISRKIAPALAAGCPVIVKPAAETPLTMLYLGHLIIEAFIEHGAPQGLLAILPTSNAAAISETFMADARLRKVTFTGSTPVGRILAKQGAQNLLHCSFELGGNAPFVINNDADIDAAVDAAIYAKMRNGGAACVAANRILVHEEVAEEFTEKFTAKMAEFKVGDGLVDGTKLGPMISRVERDRVAHLVRQAVDAGATVRLGGEIPDDSGYFYDATVLTGVSPDSEIFNTEIFGPVAAITTFSDLDEGIALANSTPFGLAAYGFSGSVHGARKLAAELQSGMVGLNRANISDPGAPFGGINQSGYGSEGGIEGIEEYLDKKYVALQ